MCISRKLEYKITKCVCDCSKDEAEMEDTATTEPGVRDSGEEVERFATYAPGSGRNCKCGEPASCNPLAAE